MIGSGAHRQEFWYESPYCSYEEFKGHEVIGGIATLVEQIDTYLRCPRRFYIERVPGR